MRKFIQVHLQCFICCQPVRKNSLFAVRCGWFIYSATVAACSNHNVCMFHCQRLYNGADLWLTWKECQEDPDCKDLTAASPQSKTTHFTDMMRSAWNKSEPLDKWKLYCVFDFDFLARMNAVKSMLLLK